MSAEKRLEQLGIKLPQWNEDTYSGRTYGRMKPAHIIGKILFIGGQIPEVNGKVIYPGRLGDTLTVEQGYKAARLTGLNILTGIKLATGDLDRVKGVVRMLHFVVTASTFYDVSKVSSGVSDLFYEVYGEKVGVGCRATIGVMSLASNVCFESWSDFELK
jgi:enamine deaminase RidA (YjgF/YER057c/UK114 family)